MDYLSSGRNRQAAGTLLDQPALIQKSAKITRNDCAFRKDWNGLLQKMRDLPAVSSVFDLLNIEHLNAFTGYNNGNGAQRLNDRNDWNGFVPSCCRWTIQHLEWFLLLPDALF